MADRQRRLQEAEVATARAEVRLGEERKRRRLAVGLAAAILTLLVFAGGGTLWFVLQKQARLTKAEVVLDRARLFYEQALSAPADLSRWDAALAGLERLELVLADYGELGPLRDLAALRARVQSGAALARRDQDLLDSILAAHRPEL